MSPPSGVRPKIEEGLVVYSVAGPAAPLIVPPYYRPFVAPEPPYVPTVRRWRVVMVNPFQAWMVCTDGPGATIAERGSFWENWSPNGFAALERFVTLADEQAQRLAAHAETWRAARVAAAEILAGGPVPEAPPAATNVHTEHCCREHGCKYGDADCPVATGAQPQSGPCEDCEPAAAAASAPPAIPDVAAVLLLVMLRARDPEVPQFASEIARTAYAPAREFHLALGHLRNCRLIQNPTKPPGVGLILTPTARQLYDTTDRAAPELARAATVIALADFVATTARAIAADEIGSAVFTVNHDVRPE